MKLIKIFFLLQIIGNSLSAQNSAIYTLPEEMIFKKHYQIESDSDQMQPYYAQVYPIGWSKNGFFAYISLVYSDGAGTTSGNLIIKNLTTNKFNSISDYGFVIEYDEYDTTYTHIKTMWQKNYKAIADSLMKYNIIQQKKFDDLSFPITTNVDSLNYAIQHTHEDVDGVSGNVSFIVTIYSKIQGKKTIHEYHNSHSSFLMGNVIGYFKSPYENRIAVILTSEHRGWEGPPNDIGYQFIGCHLKEGFLK